jgi:hypothetical protein
MLVLLMERFINYAVEMESGAMICIPSFINIGSDIQKSVGEGTHVQKHTQTGK